MSYGLIGPRCDCGRPLTPASTSDLCILCENLARAVGRTPEPISPVAPAWHTEEFERALRAWLWA